MLHTSNFCSNNNSPCKELRIIYQILFSKILLESPVLFKQLKFEHSSKHLDYLNFDQHCKFFGA